MEDCVKVDKHMQMRNVKLEAMIKASSLRRPVPPLSEVDLLETSIGWVRCMDAMSTVESKPHQSQAAEAEATGELILLSAYNITEVSGSAFSYKQQIDTLIAMHASRVFPNLTDLLSSDPHLVLLLLDAPNMFTTFALAKVYPQLLTPAFASRVCIPQADPSHYAQMGE